MCMESYLQDQDLWEIVGGSEATQPTSKDTNGVLRKWKIKVGKAMFTLKTTIEEEMLDVRDVRTSEEAWDILIACFLKKNNIKLQLIEHNKGGF